MTLLFFILFCSTKNPIFLILFIWSFSSSGSKKSANDIPKPPVGENIKDSDEVNSEDENK